MKFIDLFNLEFKKNLKSYIAVIFVICTLLMINIFNNLRLYNSAVSDFKEESTLFNMIGSTSFESIISMKYIQLIFLAGLGLCIIYSLYIWQKEFSGRNKSIYTLMTLPQNRMMVYISKLLNILCLLYMYIMAYVFTLFLAYSIYTPMMKGIVVNRGFVQETIYSLSGYIPYSIRGFVSIYVFIASAVISLVFTLYLITKRYKSIMKTMILLVLLAMSSLAITNAEYSIRATMGIDVYYSIISIVLILACYGVSSSLIKKIDF